MPDKNKDKTNAYIKEIVKASLDFFCEDCEASKDKDINAFCEEIDAIYNKYFPNRKSQK